MADFFISPNMQLTIPIATVDPGPDWANKLNASLINIDGHDHTPGSGVFITPDAINVSTDLSFNSNNATQLRTVRFTNQLTFIDSVLFPDDVGCLYEADNDLYYNPGDGGHVQITNGNAVVGAPGTIGGLPVGGPANATYNPITGTFVFQQDINLAANIDAATLIVRYPGSYPAPVGNFISLQAPSTLASGINLTLPIPPTGASAIMTLSIGGIMSTIASNAIGGFIGGPGADSIGIAMTFVGANAVAASMTNVGTTSIANTMTSANANTILNKSSNANLPGNTVQENGKNVVVSNTNAAASLAIVRVSVNAAGTITVGEGIVLTGHTNNSGIYTYNWSTPFSGSAVTVATPNQNGPNGNDGFIIVVTTSGTIGFSVRIVLQNFGPADCGFSIIAVGVRA